MLHYAAEKPGLSLSRCSVLLDFQGWAVGFGSVCVADTMCDAAAPRSRWKTLTPMLLFPLRSGGCRDARVAAGALILLSHLETHWEM